MKQLRLHLFTYMLALICLPAHALVNRSIRFQVSNGTNTDQALVGFYPNATDNYDPYDSHKFSNGDPNIPEIFFMADGEELAIDGLPNLWVNKTLDLCFRTGTAGNFTIRATEMNNLDPGLTITLRDNLLSVEQELTLSNSYAFSSAIATTYTRFTLFISKRLGKATASDRASDDRLGSAVAISGEYAVAGSNPADSTGSAYVYKLTNGSWAQVQKITADDLAANDHFGRSVAICNDLIVVGSPGKGAGAAYVFRNDAGSWTQVQKLVASDGSAGAQFGAAVSVSGNQAAVGAPNDDSGTGATYLYRNDADVWSQLQKLTASDKQTGDGFGRAVSLSGKNLLVGASDEDDDASGGNSLTSAGSAYLFTDAAGSWSQHQKWVASDRAAYDRFGSSLSLSGDVAVVGVAAEDEDAAGANTLSAAGSAYMFKNTAGTWSQAQKIVASDRAANDNFGNSVSISGNIVLVGANNEDEDARGTNSLSSAGSAYMFKNVDGTWTQQQKINAADREANDQFGQAVGFSGVNGIVGCPYDSHDDAGSNSLTAAGSAFFFRYEPLKRIWNGSSWGTAPTASDSAVVNATYDGPGFSCLDLVVNAGKKLSVSSALNVYGNFTLKSDESNGKATFVDNGNSLFVGNGVVVEQFLTGAGGSTTTGRFWYLSSPLKDATSLPFELNNVDPLNKLWSFSEPAVGYTPVASRLLLKPGTGYVARLGANKTLRLHGSELNTGDQTVSVTRTGSTNNKRGFNLVGNPYPSFVELDTADNPGLERTIWYRSLTASGTAMAFDTYNLTSNTGVVASGSGDLTAYIPPMQAFWVKVSAEGSTNLVFRNAKRSQQTGVSLRSAPVGDIRLQLTDGIQTDETLVGFYPAARNGFDPYDSHKISNESAAYPELYTLAGSDEVAINGLPSDEDVVELPLGFRTGKAGNFRFHLRQSGDRNLVLWDKLLGIKQDLTENPTYAFTSDIANTSQRFSLTVRRNATKLPVLPSVRFEAWGTEEGRIQVQTEGLPDQAEIRVYDALGRSQPLTEQVFRPGIYLVRLRSTTYSATKKVRIGR